MGFSLIGFGGLLLGFVYEKYSNKIYVYDIILNIWIIINKKLRECVYYLVFYNDGKIYVIGGKCFLMNWKIEYFDEIVEIYDIYWDILLIDLVNLY